MSVFELVYHFLGAVRKHWRVYMGRPGGHRLVTSAAAVAATTVTSHFNAVSAAAGNSNSNENNGTNGNETGTGQDIPMEETGRAITGGTIQ